MTEAAPSAPLSVTDLSARIVNETELAKPDAAKILGWMSDLVALLGPAPSESNGQLRDDTFLVAEQRFLDLHDVPALVGLLRLKARWTGNRVGYGQECAAMLASATKDRLVQAKVASAGFGSRRPVEALDRLEFLLSLAPGVAIADRTLGYGEVRREDDFYRTLEVVFDRDGAARTIGFRFAADSFRVVPPTHVLAARHANAAEFAKRCAEKPGEVVRLVLESYGDMPVARLEALMKDLVLPAGTDWKRFWSAARAQLAKDPSVVVPPATKKNANVELLRGGPASASDQTHRDVERFAASREPKEILEKAAGFLRSPGAAGFTPELRAAFADRLAFVVKASVADRRLGNRAKVQALVLAREAGLSELPVSLLVNDATRPGLLEGFRFTDDSCSVVDLAGTLAMPEIVLDAARTLPANRMEALLAQIPIEKDAEVARAFVRALPRMMPSLVDHIAPKLIAGPAAAEFAELVRAQFAQDHVYDPEAEAATAIDDEEGSGGAAADGLSLPLLRWICHAQSSAKTRKAVYGIVSPFAIASLASVALGFQAEKENLRMKNDIKRLFVAGRRDPDPKSKGVEIDEGSKWLFPLLADMSWEERASIFVRIQALEGVWEPLRKRRLVANLLKKWPNLSVHVPKARPAEARGFFRENVTSPRTYREREAQYRHLMDVEMPQNRKDIEFAKGFGDLSENFEYETARRKERELVARQQQLEEDLRRVSSFDFSAVEPSGFVGLGSHVVLAFGDGTEKEYSILGEWDSQPELGIISCYTPLAEALLDLREGDSVQLPTDGEEAPACTIKAITALPPSVLEWARG